MENFLTIALKKNPYLTGFRLEEIISPDKTEYICVERAGKRSSEYNYFISLKSTENLPQEKGLDFLGEWILNNYKKELLQEVLKSRFIGFYPDETNEILKIAEKSTSVFDEVYCKKIIVKNLSNYFKENNSLFVEGFLRFRVREFKHLIEMLLSNAIDEFYVKEEYSEFTKLLKMYLKESSSLVDLAHIQANSDGSFVLYDFKKTKLLVSFDEIELIENVFTKEDLLLSQLIALAPKKIIWHNNTEFKNPDVLDLIKDIFGNRFSECTGCELCEKEKYE